jgi:hypothetical protein
MSDAVSFAEIEEQHVELLPERTVMSLASMGAGTGGTGGNTGGNGTGGTGTAVLSGIGLLAPGTSAAGSGFGGAVYPPGS